MFLKGSRNEFNEFARGTKQELQEAFRQWKASLAGLSEGLTKTSVDSSKERLLEREKFNAFFKLNSDRRVAEPAEKFATGGRVPGSGYGDTVPALLTPGEYVLNTAAVKNIGLNNLHQMNNGGKAAKFASGGAVTSNGNGGGGGFVNMSEAAARFENSASIMKTAFELFNRSANALAQAMQNFPSSISGNFTHTVNMNIVGAEALSAIQPEMERLIVTKTKEVLNRYIQNNIPDAGLAN